MQRCFKDVYHGGKNMLAYTENMYRANLIYALPGNKNSDPNECVRKSLAGISNYSVVLSVQDTSCSCTT